MANLKEQIKSSRPNIKDSTIKMYESNLNKLKSMFDSDDFKFLKDFDKVMDKLETRHFTTIRNYMNSILIYLMAINSDKKQDTLLKKYQDKRDELNQQYEDEQTSGKISEKQSKNFVPLKDVVDMINKMGNDLKGFKKKELTAKDKMLLQIYIIFQIHVRLPMRNDLAEMESITKRAYNKLSLENKKAKNYLVVEKNKMFMVLNKFKTSSKYEELRFDVPKDLEKLLRSYLKINGLGVLFKSSTGKALSRNQISQLLIKYSKRYIGKSISTTILRKIVLSDKFGELKKEQEKMASITGHSVATMNSVYVKEGQDGKDVKS
tara:strand:+ start:9744 stop:10703 length:960 start_codon:yes stop_codon:yes gene_type:complete